MTKTQKMFLVKTKDGKKYWLNELQEDKGFFTYVRKTKTGKILKISLNKSEVREIMETDIVVKS